MLDWLRTEGRYALRGLLKDRTFTTLAVLSIGLGVGANSAIFSLVDQALFRRFGVYGPPTTAFFNTAGRECRPFRLVGFVAADDFRSHLARLAREC